MDERRQSLQPQFDRLADMITDNHEKTIQRLSRIETFQQTDRAAFKEVKDQCDEHEKVIQKGKGIFALFGALASLGIWDWFANHGIKK